MAKRSSVTIHDVAKRAGVSITAVSHALNGKGSLSDATRARVKRIADELGYQADSVARALRASQMSAVGLIIRPLDTLGDYSPSGVDFFTRFSGAAAHAAADRGLSLMLVPDLTRRPLPPLALSLDGYIVTDPVADDPIIAMLMQNELPLVTVGTDPTRSDSTPWVATDDAGNTAQVLEALANSGAREIAFVAGTDDNAWNLDAIAAHRTFCEERGTPARLLRIPEAEGESGGRRAGVELAADGLPDAAFCLTGRHAAGLLREVTDRGIAVPDDFEIAAASDSEHTRSAGITSLDMRPAELAASAVSLLDAVTRGDGSATALSGQLTRGHVILRSTTRHRPRS